MYTRQNKLQTSKFPNYTKTRYKPKSAYQLPVRTPFRKKYANKAPVAYKKKQSPRPYRGKPKYTSAHFNKTYQTRYKPFARKFQASRRR